MVLATLAAALTYPRTPSDWLEMAFPLRSSTEVRARVVSTRRETNDVTTLVLAPNARWRGHRAGQHVALTAEIAGVRRTRVFSIASSPDDGLLSITIKARPDGIVTPFLVHGLRAGAIVSLSQATGEFVLPEVAPTRAIFVSGGSGITPVMSMLRTLVGREHEGEVLFLHYARSREDVIFARELLELHRAEVPGLRILIETEREAGRAPSLDERSLAALVPDFESWDAWVCGPDAMRDAALRAYAARSAAKRVRVERYSLSTSTSANGDGGAVTFTRSNARANGKGPILALAESAGLTPDSGCRMGICGTCKCRKISGRTRDLRSGEIDAEPRDDFRPCVSEAVGDVEIDL
jgi:ferredoxin-NADP reductase